MHEQSKTPHIFGLYCKSANVFWIIFQTRKRFWIIPNQTKPNHNFEFLVHTLYNHIRYNHFFDVKFLQIFFVLFCIHAYRHICIFIFFNQSWFFVFVLIYVQWIGKCNKYQWRLGFISIMYTAKAAFYTHQRQSTNIRTFYKKKEEFMHSHAYLIVCLDLWLTDV